MLEIKLTKEEVMSLIDKEILSSTIANKIWAKHGVDNLDDFDPIVKQTINEIDKQSSEIVKEWMDRLDTKDEINKLVSRAISDLTKEEILNKLIK